MTIKSKFSRNTHNSKGTSNILLNGYIIHVRLVNKIKQMIIFNINYVLISNTVCFLSLFKYIDNIKNLQINNRIQ